MGAEQLVVCAGWRVVCTMPGGGALSLHSNMPGILKTIACILWACVEGRGGGGGGRGNVVR